MQARFKLVLFDFDGTLVDTSDAICASMRRSFESFDCPAPDDKLVRSTIGLSLDESMRKFCTVLGCEFHDEMPNKYRYIYDVEGLGLQLTTLYPGAHNVLSAIRTGGAKVAVISNKGEGAVAAALQSLGLDALIHCAVGEHPQFKRKPSVDPFFRVLKEFDIEISPQDVLVVGDTTTDVSFAKNVGAPICWARYGYSHDDLSAAGGLDYVIDSLEQLVSIVVDEWSGLREVANV